jgi:hypothetical protein
MGSQQCRDSGFFSAGNLGTGEDRLQYNGATAVGSEESSQHLLNERMNAACTCFRVSWWSALIDKDQQKPTEKERPSRRFSARDFRCLSIELAQN